MSALRLTLPGPPRTKKTSNRLVRAGARHRILPSKAWEEWRDVCWVASGPWRRKWLEAPLAFNVNVTALFYRDARRGDAVGYYQGLGDVLEYCAIVANDKYITQWDGSRLLVDRDNPRVELEITPV